jgi:hypothetical protein
MERNFICKASAFFFNRECPFCAPYNNSIIITVVKREKLDSEFTRQDFDHSVVQETAVVSRYSFHLQLRFFSY